MFIQYDEYALLALFESEPKIMNSEPEIYTYSKQNELGFELSLHFSVYDQYAVISMSYGVSKLLLLEAEIKNISSIKADSKEIRIFQEGNDKKCIMKVSFVPNFKIDMNVT